MNNQEARARAGDAAHYTALQSLRDAHDPVPCPFCERVQEAAIRDISSRRMALPTQIAGHVALVALIVAGVMTAKEWQGAIDRGRLIRADLVVVGIAWTICLVWYLVCRRVLHINPARFDFLPPDHKLRLAPPALLEHRDEMGIYYFPAKPVRIATSGGSIIVQMHRIGLPPNCLGCGTETTRMFAPPIAMDHETKTYPCCENCQRGDARRWRVISAISALTCLLITALVAFAPPPVHKELRYVITAILVPITAVTAIAAPNLLGQPLQRRIVDRKRGWVRVHARNQAYQQLLEKRYQDARNYVFRGAGISPKRI